MPKAVDERVGIGATEAGELALTEDRTIFEMRPGLDPVSLT